ncbi:MAG: MATE family efflux transporter [Paramuribaculum sp.]|nr:MATE family efflux transporter [Paramuribaculum sp.]
MRGHKQLISGIAALAIPAIITNITTPILGLTDMAIVGHIGGAVLIAAIAVGGSAFNMLYWLCGFLRMGTSGLTAQYFGAHDSKSCSTVLARAMIVAMSIGVSIVVLQQPVFNGIMMFMDCDDATRITVHTYFSICIWGAPAVLGTFVLTGWWLGMQNSRTPMWVSIFINLFNISVSLIMVFGGGLHIEGVAIGTLSAQWAGFLLGTWLCKRKYTITIPPLCQLLQWAEIKKFFRINTDIFLRTICLVCVTMWFTRIGAMQGALMLAVNALLMQLFTLFSFFMDGFAFAAEALCGRFKGSGNITMLRRTVRTLMTSAGVVALTFTIIYALAGNEALRLLSSDRQVISTSGEYYRWAVSIPLSGFAAFMWDGVSIGISATRRMLMSMLCSTALFFLIYAIAYPMTGNHGLWLAFIAYLLTRGIALWLLNRKYLHQESEPYSAR